MLTGVGASFLSLGDTDGTYPLDRVVLGGSQGDGFDQIEVLALVGAADD